MLPSLALRRPPKTRRKKSQMTPLCHQPPTFESLRHTPLIDPWECGKSQKGQIKFHPANFVSSSELKKTVMKTELFAKMRFGQCLEDIHSSSPRNVSDPQSVLCHTHTRDIGPQKHTSS